MEIKCTSLSPSLSMQLPSSLSSSSHHHLHGNCDNKKKVLCNTGGLDTMVTLRSRVIYIFYILSSRYSGKFTFFSSIFHHPERQRDMSYSRAYIQVTYAFLGNQYWKLTETSVAPGSLFVDVSDILCLFMHTRCFFTRPSL